MRISRYIIPAYLLLFTACGGEEPTNVDKMKEEVREPDAIQDRHVMWEHGNKRIDQYYWMNQRDSKEVIAYLEAENEYREAEMATTIDLQQELYDEMVSRTKVREESTSVPPREGSYMTEST